MSNTMCVLQETTVAFSGTWDQLPFFLWGRCCSSLQFSVLYFSLFVFFLCLFSNVGSVCRLSFFDCPSVFLKGLLDTMSIGCNETNERLKVNDETHAYLSALILVYFWGQGTGGLLSIIFLFYLHICCHLRYC